MSKTTLRLALILIILWGAAYIYKGPLQENTPNESQVDNILSDLNPESLQKIEIAKDGATTTLEKTGESFKVEGTKDFYVNKQTTKRILEGLSDAKEASIELVSSNEEKKQDFGTNEEGLTVRLIEEGKDAVELVIGELGSNFIDTYVSMPHTPDTYSIKENLLRLFDKDDWRDKVMFSDSKESLNYVRFQYPDRQFEAIKDEAGNWTIKDKNTALDSSKLANLLSTMTNLEAAQIPAQTFDGTGLEKHLIIVQVKGTDIDNTIMVGDSKEITADPNNPFGGEAQTLYFAKKGSSDNIYLISEEAKNFLDVTIEDLK